MNNNIQKCIGFHMFQNLQYTRRRRMMITIRARQRALLQRLLRLCLEQKFNLIFMWKVIINNPGYNSPVQNRTVGNSSYVQSLIPSKMRFTRLHRHFYHLIRVSV